MHHTIIQLLYPFLIQYLPLLPSIYNGLNVILSFFNSVLELLNFPYQFSYLHQDTNWYWVNDAAIIMEELKNPDSEISHVTQSHLVYIISMLSALLLFFNFGVSLIKVLVSILYPWLQSIYSIDSSQQEGWLYYWLFYVFVNTFYISSLVNDLLQVFIYYVLVRFHSIRMSLKVIFLNFKDDQDLKKKFDTFIHNIFDLFQSIVNKIKVE